MIETQQGTRADPQLSAMAGEFLVAGKLFKRGLQVSVTMGNAKSIDLFAHNPQTGRTFTVQVKTVRDKNCYPMTRESIRGSDILVFVILNGVNQDEEFFILLGKTVLNDIDHFFGSSYRGARSVSMPGVNYGPLKEFKDNWALFETTADRVD